MLTISAGALERILRYILNAEVSVTQLEERLAKVKAKPLRSKTMTLADQLILKGKQEGQLQAFRTAVLRSLEVRHGSCPEGIREALESINDPARLEALIESAFRSESLESFAQNL